MQPAKSLKLGILALLFVALIIFSGCGGTTPPINHSPTIIILTADSSSININQSITITSIATDQDGDTLTYIWTKVGGTISGSGSVITWIAPSTAGTYAITCIVSDGRGGQDSESVNIEVFELDDETKITNTIHGLFQAFNDKDWNTAKSYCVYGSEVYQEIADYEQCYNIYGAYQCAIPDECIVNNINPIIIDGDYAEAYVYLTLIAGDTEVSGENWFYLQKIDNDWRLYGYAGGATPAHYAPEIISTAITSATVGEAYTYDVDATDSDGDTLAYSLDAAPTGMTIEVHTGVINWTPTAADVGIHSVIVEVSDGELTDTQTFIITVLAVEQEFQDNQETITHHLEEIAEPGKTPERYAQELAALLMIMNENNVSEVEVFGNFVNITYNTGKVHCVRFTDKEEGDDDYLKSGGILSFKPNQKGIAIEESKTDLSNTSYSPQREVSATIPLEQQTIGIQDFSKGSLSRDISEEEKIAVNCNILVWDPDTLWGTAQVANLALKLTGGGNLGFDIELMVDSSCTIDSLKKIINYGMVIIESHGNGSGFDTGEKWTEAKYAQYNSDLDIYTVEGFKLTDTPPFFEIKGSVHFGVFYSWFKKNLPENNNNTIMISNACKNGNQTFWDYGLKGRVGDFFGWDGNTNMYCNNHATGSLMEGLKSGESNTVDAYVPYTCFFTVTNWRRFGDPVRFPSDTSNTNQPPIISSLSANPPSVDIDQTTTITCFASDPDGDPLTYHWTKNGGAFVGSTSGSSVTWRAPSTEGNYSVECEISDGEGGEDSDSVNIVVTETEEPSGAYALRDIGPAGGYIFYDKGYYSSGWRYLEAAPKSTEWTGKQWGSYGTLIGGTEKEIGTGKSNTTIIVTWLNNHSETDRAAQLCNALVYGGYSDWFLPSLDELNLMNENLKDYGIGGFESSECRSDYYWSSSEGSAHYALFQVFTYGICGYSYGRKHRGRHVRAVRAF